MPDRPFRAPHHTISNVALIGGGSQPRPGEVSLAHHGVLFLDEMLEFHRGVLEVLRQPLEEGHVTVARAARTVTFPARFVLVGAMNPCPCGFAGDPVHDCRCTPQQIAKYRGRISGPLLDRLTSPWTCLECPTFGAGESGEPSAPSGRESSTREAANRGPARRRRTNSALTPQMMATLSARSGLRILRVRCSDWVSPPAARSRAQVARDR